MSCPFCGSDDPSQSQFCRACGAELPRLSASGDASTDALPVGTLLLGTYALESVLGQGGFGITYCCHDQMLDRQVAIKEFFPAGCRREDALVQPSRGLSDSHFSEARAQFLAEARLLARCHHAGIVGVHTAFEANSTAYMVMELLHGSHLSQLLEARGGRLSEAEAVPLIERAGEALQFVHDKGLLHRDIKPENIIATDDGRVMLIDFGTAREYAQGQAQGHTIVVTPGYAPLEQYAKQARRGAFTDVYGLAATFYHLVTGNQPPAASDRAVGVQLRPVREENPQISRGVAQAIEAGLEMEIAKRPQSVREFLELMHATATQAVEATALEVALRPQEDPTANAQRDALLSLSHAPAGFSSDALHARLQILDKMHAGESPAQPVQLAPLVAPQSILPKTAPLSVPLVFSMSADPDGGIQFKNASTAEANNTTKFIFGWIGATTVILGLVAWVGSSTLRTQPSYYTSPVVSYSSPGSPSSTYSSNQPPVSRSIMRNPEVAEVAARRERESSPLILPVSVETLPSSIESSTDAKISRPENSAKYSYVLSRGWAAFSPDNQLVAYMDREAVVRVWNLANHRLVSSLPQSKSHPPAAIRFAPDNKKVVLTYQDQGKRESNDQVTVWNLATGKSEGTLSVDPQKEWISAQTVLPDGKVLITQSDLNNYQQSWFAWDPRTGRRSEPPIMDKVVFSADGEQMVTGDNSGHIRWRDARTGVLRAEQSTVLTYRDFQSSPLYASDTPGNARLTDTLPVETLRFSRNGSYLASSNKMQIRVFDANAREIGALPIGHSPAFAVSPDGKFVVEGGGWKDSRLNLLWNVRNGQKIRVQAPVGRIQAWIFSPDGKQIIGFSSARHFSLVTWRTDARSAALFSAPQVTPVSLLVSPQTSPRTSIYRPGQTVSLFNRLIARQIDQSLEIRRFDSSLVNALNIGESPISEAAFSPDGRFLSSRASKGETRLWNVKTGKQVAQLEALGPMEHPRSPSLWYRGFIPKRLMFSPDNNLLAHAGTAQGKNLIEVWSLKKTPRRIASFVLGQPPTAFTFSADNRSLICGDVSGKLHCYDVATQKLRGGVGNGPAPISQLASTEQGLVVVSRDKSAMLITSYDVTSSDDTTGLSAGQKRWVFQKKGQVPIAATRSSQDSLAISPDGKFVAAASFYSEGPSSGVDVWHLPMGSLIQKLSVEMPIDESFRSGGMSPFTSTSVIDALSFSLDGSQLRCMSRDVRRGLLQATTWQSPSREKPSP